MPRARERNRSMYISLRANRSRTMHSRTTSRQVARSRKPMCVRRSVPCATVGLDAPDDLPSDKMRADYIRLRNIHFRPERSLLGEVGSGVSFERAGFSSRSRQYTEEQILSLLRHYFATHTCLTRRDLQRMAGLRDSAAKKWLRRLTATGVLQRDGASNAPVYLWRG